ncbi:MAG: amidohydrolase family protein [Clostridiaceae bacterium]|nr:amidohydrolase family protein [Clostridiaceae bacterium]
MYDILLKNGIIVDGTGSAPFVSDIAVTDGKIVKISANIRGDAKEIIDICNQYVTPGFIDIHRHSDASILRENFGEIELRQGITTTLNGNCGLSIVPCPDNRKDMIFKYLKPIIGTVNIDSNFQTFSEYYEMLRHKSIPINFGSNIGNGTVRMAVKGFEKGNLTQEQIEKAHAFILDGIENGAFGVSMGVVYMPENCYDLNGFIEVLQPIKNTKIPIITHIRGEGDLLLKSIEEVILIAKSLNVPLHISHFKCVGKHNWGHLLEKAIELLDKARSDGMKITCDVYPYTAGSTQLVQLLPPEFLEGGMEETTNRLKDSNQRKKIKDILEKKQTKFENLLASVGWESIMITSLYKEENQKYIGMRVTEIAQLQNKDPYDCAFDLLVEENCDVSMVNFIVCDKDIETILKYEHSCIISDSIYPDGGIPHPRLYGTFTKVLCDYVRDRKVLTLPEAIRKITFLPSKIMNIVNKGLLKEGFDADITVFELKKLVNGSSYVNPKVLGKGFDYVIVNGIIAVKNDVLMKNNSGKIIMRGL